ncbi:MAG: M50 family metallopeptidase [Promethearchaeota archaeon]
MCGLIPTLSEENPSVGGGTRAIEDDSSLRKSKLKRMVVTFIAMYVILYASSWIHESGHVVTALLTGGYYTDFQVSPWTGGSVRVFGGNLTIVASAGGLSQGAFYLILVKWERTMVIPYYLCVLYAMVEATLIPYQSYLVVYASVTFIMSLAVVLATSLLLRERMAQRNG